MKRVELGEEVSRKKGMNVNWLLVVRPMDEMTLIVRCAHVWKGARGRQDKGNTDGG
jgi:hypothetical protein